MIEAETMINAITQQNNSIAISGLNENTLDSFINYLDASPKTVETYNKAIRQFYRYIWEKGIAKPTRETVLEYRDSLKESHKPTTVQNYITALKLFFRWTAQEGIYPDIADHVKGAKLDKNHKKDYLTSKQVKKVLEIAKGNSEQALRDYAILALMFTGGLRTIEVSRANIEDLRAAGDDMALYIQGKGREEKTEYVKIMPEVEDALRAYLRARGVTDPEQPLFASTSNNNKGQRMTTRSISGIVKNAFKAAGYESDKLTAHSTRHTAVTLALMNNENLEAVKQFARHKSLETTLIYSHSLERANNHCESTIANAIFN